MRALAPPPALTLVALVALLTPAAARAEGPVRPGERVVFPVAAAGEQDRPVDPAALVRDALATRVPWAQDAMLVPRDEVAAGGGVTQLRFRQEIGDVPVHHGEHVVAVRADGSVLAVILGDVADAGDPGVFVLGAAEAAAIADVAVSGGAPSSSAEARLSTESVAPGWMSVELPSLGAPAYARQVVHPRGPRVAWRVEVPERGDSEERWCVLVDARTGDVLEMAQVTNHAAARGRVYPRGMRGGSEIREFVDPDVVMDLASPAGWIDVDRTIGNNVYVWEDRAGDGTTTEGLTAVGTGDPLTFDFPFTGVPLDDLDAALTNVFWALNATHDRLWRLGFDERSGNMQARNFGRGGLGADYTRVFVQYRAGATATGIRNTSTAGTSADGSYNSLTFGLWNLSGEVRDGAFDTTLVVHEYAHLAIVRLAGGDSTCDDGNQPAGLAEGWADYVAASFTGERVMGAWVAADPAVGIRLAPVGASTFAYNNLCGTNPASTNCSATENGEIWSSTLWELRDALILANGPQGADLADKLVLEGLRYTPCRPTYLEARDGILLADLALTGGANRCLIWQAMANRGMGADAVTTGPDDRYPTAGYSLGPECASAAAVAWDRPRYGDDADAKVQLADARAGAAPRTLRVTSTGGDAEDIVVPAPGTGPGAVRIATVPLRAGAPAPGDGLLQVAAGGSVTATCTDCGGAPSASATVSRALAVTVNSHQLSSESCHDDDSEALLADFTAELPSILDAGEIATVSVTLGNAEEFALEDVRVLVTCDNPNVQILPVGEIPVGAVRGRFLNPSGFVLTLRALVAPWPAVQFGDTATLTFRVRARGLEGTTSLTVFLAGDYTAERGVVAWGGTETFEPASPSAGSWSHYAAGGQPADWWSFQDCGNGGGRTMAYTGAGCTTYDDTPSAATLVSPPVFDFSNRVQAVHPMGLTWWNDADLGYSTNSNYCDSELVVAYLTDNPNRPNYASPRSDRSGTLNYWVQWPALGVTRNTGGWVQQGPTTALSNSSVSGMSLPDVKLWWVFFTDVYNPRNDGGCRITDREGVAGGYKLDDVTFTYDLARVVAPVNTTCVQACVARTVLAISPPGGARCAGDPITLSAVGSELAGCTGSIEYNFTGPGFSTGYTPSPTAVAVAADGATWTVTARCSSNTGCSQSASVSDPTKDDTDVGRVRAGTLRARRDGDDVILEWDGTRVPPSYAIFRADSDPADGAGRLALLGDLAGAPPSDALRAASADDLWHRDAGAAVDGTRLSCYRVFSRVPCAGTALDR